MACNVRKMILILVRMQQSKHLFRLKLDDFLCSVLRNKPYKQKILAKSFAVIKNDAEKQGVAFQLSAKIDNQVDYGFASSQRYLNCKLKKLNVFFNFLVRTTCNSKLIFPREKKYRTSKRRFFSEDAI